MDDSAIIFDEVIDADYEAKLYDETSFHERKEPIKRNAFMFYLHFYYLL